MTAAVSFLPREGTSLLDVGCGNGAFLSFVEQLRPEISACGVEPSEVAVGRKWCASTIVRGHITQLPFPDRSFDVVCSMAVLEHVPQHQMAQGLSELVRVTRGHILIDLPFRERRTRIQCPECGCGFDPHLHLRSYSKRDILALFPGFAVTDQRVLRGREALIPYIVLRVLGREWSAARFPNAVCPQCEYRTEAAAGDSRARKALLRRLWELQPTIRVKREMFVVFKRP